MATTFFNFGATLDRIEQKIDTLSQLVATVQAQEVSMATVLVDLQGAETRIAADLKRAAAMIMTLSQGHTVADADVEAVVTMLNAASDAFDAANPPPPPGP